MRRLVLGLAITTAVWMLGCGPSNFPKENPRLSPQQQQEAKSAEGNEGDGSSGPVDQPVGDTAPPEGGE